MSCDPFREALSAQIDGEDGGMSLAALDAHLADCGDCRAFALRMASTARAVRLQPAEPVPDLTVSILTAIAATPARRSFRWDPSETPGVIRLTLALVALTQVVAAAPAVVGNDLGAPIHVAHEQAAWGLALAAGLLFAAWRPSRAAALVPMLGVFVLCLGTMTALDIAAGRVAPSSEVPHLMAAFGLGLLWLESHPMLTSRVRLRT
jgi:predicted anti-sigma-YlaC factor YlaD